MLQNSQSSIMESATATEGRGGSRTRKFEMVIVMVRMMKVMILMIVVLMIIMMVRRMLAMLQHVD